MHYYATSLCLRKARACAWGEQMKLHNANKHRPRLFRVFVTSQYYANRDEYDQHYQQQPYTFEQYVSNNLTQLRKDYKLHKQQLLR